jgi:urease beta subunit
LNVAAGTAVRFEPGDAKRVMLVELAGAQRVHGLNALTEGGGREAALSRLAQWERPAGPGS